MKTQAGGPVTTESETELVLAGSLLKQGFTDKQVKLVASGDILISLPSAPVFQI
jgi:hypothetical protein